MIDESKSPKDPLDHLDQFRAMAEERKAQINPPWHKGFGTAAVPFVAGMLCLLHAWATWDRKWLGDVENNPVLTLVLGVVMVAFGLARRDVRVRVPLYGVVVDGRPAGLDWPDKLAMERRAASKEAILGSWQRLHPDAEVELVALWDAWVYVPRDLVEYAGSKNLTSR